MVTVEHNDLSLAFDFVSSAAQLEHRAYVCMDTGVIYWISELNPLEEEVPEDLETSDRYIAVRTRMTWTWDATSHCVSQRRNCRISTRRSRTSFDTEVLTGASKNSWRHRAVSTNGTRSKRNPPRELSKNGVANTISKLLKATTNHRPNNHHMEPTREPPSTTWTLPPDHGRRRTAARRAAWAGAVRRTSSSARRVSRRR